MGRYTLPKQGTGWEAFQTEDSLESLIEEGVLDEPASYGFDSLDEMHAYVEQHGFMQEYEVATVPLADKNMKYGLRQPHNESDQYDAMQPPKCDQCLEELNDLKTSGAIVHSEILPDPNMYIRESTETSPSNRVGRDLRIEHRTQVYCPEHEENWFAYTTINHE